MSADTHSEIRILSICHYVLGGLTALVSLIPLIHLATGLFMLFGPPASQVSDPAEQQVLLFTGGLFVVIASIAIAVGLLMGVCQILAGRWLAAYRNHTFCIVIAGLECLNMPLGTVLGILTIVFLQKEEIKQPFGAGTP